MWSFYTLSVKKGEGLLSRILAEKNSNIKTLQYIIVFVVVL
jgi:hypothetical protein